MFDALTNLLAVFRFGWSDLLDIAIVSFLIYQFLSIIRHTRAVQIIVGGIFVVALYYASELVTLRTVNWVVGEMFGYAVFAAIVLFQNDIRRGLSLIGRDSFFRLVTRRAVTDQTIEAIVKTVSALSAQKRGALVAIERDIGLRTYVDSGTSLDAKVNYDLLVSVFQSSSPLHDGAVIVQDNRICAAGCLLPLTVDTQRAQLGTRHRAAIGLTEESDAVALVVSEETGVISLAIDGEIEHGLDDVQLTFRLEALLQQTSLIARVRRKQRGQA
tara:strand:+ start:120 stop:935 length:816 start_codon:yes stop_codon:yes gene_type:complete